MHASSTWPVSPVLEPSLEPSPVDACESVPLRSAVVSLSEAAPVLPPPSVGSDAPWVLAIVAESEFEPASSVVLTLSLAPPPELLAPVVLPSPPVLDEAEPPCEAEAPARSSPQAGVRVRAPTSSQFLVLV